MAVLVGKKAPDFTASAVINGEEIIDDFKLSDYSGKYVILFFIQKTSLLFGPTSYTHSKRVSLNSNQKALN